MVAFTARDPQAYLADLYGNLNPSSNINLLPITLSELAFQVRYRYELMPLAYLYVVYTKGGRIVADDTEDDLSELYKRPWNCLLYTSPSPRDTTLSRMPSSA